MRAIYYENFGEKPTLESLPDPTPDKDGVVVKVLASGICRSDWHGWMGHDPDIRLPHVPGHELVGEIVEVGRKVRLCSVGDRITVPFVSGCGRCESCVAGDRQICDDQFQPGFTGWGSFAEYVALKYADLNVVRLPERITSIDAVSLGCRFITSYRGLRDVAGLKSDEYLLVIGCGGVGLSAIMIGSAIGAEVIAVDIHQQALELARKAGARHLINAKDGHVSESVLEITRGGAHVSMDALGSRETCTQSISSLRKRGRHVQVGLLTGSDLNPPLPMHQVIARELAILGSHGMASSGYSEIFELMEQNRVRPGEMVTRTVSLPEAIPVLSGMDSSSQPGITVINEF